MLRRLAACLCVAGLSLAASPAAAAPAPPAAGAAGLYGAPYSATPAGYWLVAANGAVLNAGRAGLYGARRTPGRGQRVSAMAATPDGGGYWLVTAGGAVFNYGDAGAFGPARAVTSGPVVGMAATPDGGGYWLVTAGGAVSSYGDAGAFGPARAAVTSGPVVGMAATPDGGGYWLVTAGGAVSSYGDAGAFGPARAVTSGPVVGMAATPDGGGYWLVTAGGAVSSYGDAGAFGPARAAVTSGPVVGMAATPDGGGYWLVTAGGAVSGYGDAGAFGPAPAPGARVVGVVADAQGAAARAGAGSSRAASATTNALALPALGPVSTSSSANWSGYAVSGAAYTAVSGTFTVPAPAADVAGSTLCEWVGIDGWTDRSLIQAGVDEVSSPGGPVVYQPWWETYPGPQVPVAGVAVAAGDRVTVRLGQLSAGQWAITVTDDTNSESSRTVSSYDGPGSSAEWVVEAERADNASSAAQSPLTPYAPQVAFSGLGTEPAGPGASPSATSPVAAAAVVSRIVMVQGGTAVSTPSGLSPQGGFSVAYGAVPPTGAA